MNTKLLIKIVLFAAAVLFFYKNMFIYKKTDHKSIQDSEVPAIASEFPQTGDVRWFIATRNEPGGLAALTIVGSRDIGKNIIVRLDTWDSHTPVAMIPIRGGETANLQVPLGRYRFTYSVNPAWHEGAKIFGDAQEALDPLVFYLNETQS